MTKHLNQNKMVLLFLGIAMVVSLYLFSVVSDDYSNWGEEYMDEELKKHKLK